MRFYRLGAVLLSALMITSAAQPSRFGVLTESVYARGFERPAAMTFTPDGNLLVAEQDGGLWVISPDAAVRQITKLDTAWEYTGRGLLGLTLDPDFSRNGYLYLYYTVYSDDVRNVVARLTLDASLRVIPGSETVLVTLDAQETPRHTGGTLRFGPDGMLYLGVGDNAITGSAQSLDTRFGKLLRYRPDGSIPADNPFYEAAEGGNRAIWAIGLRNPHTFAFDPDSGALYINDVGETAWEEINLGAAGANYGWPLTEGPAVTDGQAAPLYAFSHSEGRCAVDGALFYSDTRFPPALLGDYLFSDLCTGTIYALDRESGLVLTVMQTDAGQLVDLDLGPDGAVYGLSYGGGSVVRIAYTPENNQ
jgi:glucose/arabinose dehydrogenase